MSDREDMEPEDGKAGEDKPTRGIEGYWKSIAVPRDHEDRDERKARVLAASQRRKDAEAAEAAKGRPRAHQLLGMAMRGRVRDVVAILAVFVIGIAVGLTIISQQKAALPAWVPIFGEEFFHLEAELSTAQAITPGQGQAVMIAGIEVGQIESAELEDGHAVIGMKIEPKYAPIIREDAGLLPRPKTNLQDMVVEIDPGTPEAPPIADEATIPLANTRPNINPDEFLARLDADTRNYLVLLLQGGAEGLGGRGRELSKGLRRFEPFTRYIAELNTAIDRRRGELERVVHNFRLLTEELASKDEDITRFVDASADALGGFAAKQQSIQDALVELPSTLDTTRGALDSANALSTELRPTLSALIPQAKAFGPGLEATASLFENTTPTLRDQLRPFAEQVGPVVSHTRQLAKPLDKTVDKFGGALTELNYGFNELGYDPGDAKPGFLFYLPWLNHNLNSGYSLQDGMGPLRRGMVMLTCNSTYLAGGFVPERPSLDTVYQATNIPTAEEICP